MKQIILDTYAYARLLSDREKLLDAVDSFDTDN